LYSGSISESYVDDLLSLIWQSVALSLAFTYFIGTLDFLFFQATHFGFRFGDVAIIAIPGAICIVILAVDRFARSLKQRGRK
jgi:hypothetical protein